MTKIESDYSRRKSFKNIKLFYIFSFLDAFWPSNPFFIIYFAQITGSYTLAMSLGAIHNMVTTFMEVPTGILSDKFSRKTVTTCGSIMVFISSCLYVSADNYIMLVCASVFYGIYIALMSGNNDALIYDSLKENDQEKEFHKVCGKKDGIAKLSFGLSALLGAFIVWLLGIRETFYMTIVSSFFMIILSLRISEPLLNSHKISENPFLHFATSVKNIWKNKRLRYLTIASGLDAGIGYAGYDFVNAFFNRFVPTWLLGILRTVSYTMGAFGNFLSHKISNVLGYTKTIITFIGINYVVNLLSVLANSVASPFIKVFDNVTFGVAEPAQNSLMQHEFSDSQRATMGSVVSLFKSLFYGIFSIIIGLLADYYGEYTAILIMYISFFFLLPIYYKGLSK